MKTRNIVTKTIGLSSGLALAAVIAAGLPEIAPAAEQMKGAQHLMHLQQIRTQNDLDQLKTGDTIAMVCAKCKTVWVTQIKRDAKGAHLLAEGGQVKALIGTHACAGCNSTIEVVGVQKGAHTEVKHTCKACGDDSAFCCATKRGSGPTKGMEKEKK